MIDNKIRSYLYTIKGKGIANLRILPIQDLRFFPYIFEQRVTHGLGYASIRKAMGEIKTHTQEGLIRHLANIELVSLYRRGQISQALSREYTSALVELERNYIQHVNFMEDNLKEINKSMDGIIKKTEPPPKSTNASKKNEEPLYKRFLHKIGF